MTVSRPALLAILIPAAFAIIVWSLSTGTIDIPLRDVLTALTGTDSTHAMVIREIRAPRTLGGFLAGAMLALAGAMLQVLLRNPLADPYVLGISGGASVAALAVMLTGAGFVGISFAATTGAALATALVFALAYGRGVWSSTRLLLTGVVLASGWGALISFLLSISEEHQVFGMLFWLMGDLGNARPGWASIAVLIVVAIVAMLNARDMNLVATGELRARSLGVNVQKLRITLFLATSILTAAAVTLAGTIGFVGLVVPHMIRLIGGTDHRSLLPASLLAGGSLVVAADTLARTLLAPRELPVGVVTAFIGVPLFLVLLRKTLSRSLP
ncbi:MAG: iron ABC transporter [marine bacterium B5-7]|nr:MAG: iron ABC transporter [marine bacterium B5-7]